MRVLILGAAGQISRLLTKQLLLETDHDLVLYGRNIKKRVQISDPKREIFIEGDFNDEAQLKAALHEVDLVYLNDMNSPEATKKIVKAMEDEGVHYLIGANILGIYNEVKEPFGAWNARMVGPVSTKRHLEAAETVEHSSLNYAILRLTWLYDQSGNEKYMLSQKDEPFIGAQVTREAVARLIMDIIQSPESYKQVSLGVSEPNTDWPKPSFY